MIRTTKVIIDKFIFDSDTAKNKPMGWEACPLDLPREGLLTALKITVKIDGDSAKKMQEILWRSTISLRFDANNILLSPYPPVRHRKGEWGLCFLNYPNLFNASKDAILVFDYCMVQLCWKYVAGKPFIPFKASVTVYQLLPKTGGELAELRELNDSQA